MFCAPRAWLQALTENGSISIWCRASMKCGKARRSIPAESGVIGAELNEQKLAELFGLA